MGPTEIKDHFPQLAIEPVGATSAEFTRFLNDEVAMSRLQPWGNRRAPYATQY
ncbi:MAG: hypothetical protein AAB115_04555 [Pseudomonadota bacterium]